jgi:hypothetical protein
MKTFNDLYFTIKDFEPQPRSLSDLGIILSKAYSTLKHERFIKYSPFEDENSVINTDRVTIERLIKELNESESNDDGTFILKSEGIERAITDIKTLEVQTRNPSYEAEEFVNMFDFTLLKANLLYIIGVSRHGLTLLKQQIIRNNIEKLKNKNERLNYLNSILINLRQNERFIDKVQFESLLKFIELEITKWNQIIEKEEPKKHFSSTKELQDFIVNLVNDKLEKNIRYFEGYRNFWRDEKCLQEQKKENEIHPFIKSILKPYCDERNIKITRENSVANGRIDMVFSYLNFNVCLEVKKAHHQDVISAVNSQLSEYMVGEETDYGIYLVLWYKSDSGFNEPIKYQTINDLIAEIRVTSDIFKIQIIGIDCTKPTSPSKR